MTVHLWSKGRHAVSAMRAFTAGKTTIPNGKGDRVHKDDLLPGTRIVIHSPLTRSKAETVRQP